MTLERYRNNNPRSAAEIADAIEEELQTINPNAPVIEGTQNFAYINAFATTIAEQQEDSLDKLYDSAYVVDATGEELTKKASEIGVKRRDAIAATGVARFSSDSAVSQDRTIPSGTLISTGGDNPVTFETTEKTTITSGTTSADANIAATDTGPLGNVGADTITVLVEKPAGVDSVTNPEATGDPDLTLTDGTTPLTTGRAQEDDESLRERALESSAIGGAGTAEAVEIAIENIDEVNSADVFTNRSDLTDQNVDPWHTEVRVFGGDINNIAPVLFDTMAIGTIKTLQGGANGTLESTTITTSDLYGDLTIEITRPTKVSLEINIDIVHDATYGGTDEVKNAIVRYIGGTTTDSRTMTGLTQGENVLVNEVENVSEDVPGADFADVTLVDSDGDGNDDTTTDADGVPIFSVSNTEVATVAASDITVSETAR